MKSERYKLVVIVTAAATATATEAPKAILAILLKTGEEFRLNPGTIVSQIKR
jgi:hypothetical protein